MKTKLIVGSVGIIFAAIVISGIVNSRPDISAVSEQPPKTSNTHKQTTSIQPTIKQIKVISNQVQTVENDCHPSYSGCLNPNASDYDCIGGTGNGPYYTGRVQVIGPDVFGLDRDHDGWGCD